MSVPLSRTVTISIHCSFGPDDVDCAIEKHNDENDSDDFIFSSAALGDIDFHARREDNLFDYVADHGLLDPNIEPEDFLEWIIDTIYVPSMRVAVSRRARS